ncbi:hypothetical protein CcI49_14085 [Frankia sp. CcI49]|uniref:hypothetical protein n=1 Tax=unclassified Frankia TaxID=2632575 RepID=UPI0006CA2ED0|nr:MULTISPECIES: hypothetical protein [unclassified Frankia]KPM52432.1 hypothetical protein ACG83_29140 [Frankia sp. R43]ONH59856.1 hypothetical protein CcI49_14085 [Frankia sp. CcI49]
MILIRASRLRRCVLAAVGVPLLAAALTFAGSSPALARPIGECTPLQSFQADLGSGEDDLRGNSEVIISLVTRSRGGVDLAHITGGVPSYEHRLITLDYGSPTIPVDSCDVAGVTVRMISHNGVFETTDNWDLDRFTLKGFDGPSFWGFPLGRTGLSISDQSFPLLHRFTGHDPLWQFLD